MQRARRRAGPAASGRRSAPRPPPRGARPRRGRRRPRPRRATTASSVGQERRQLGRRADRGAPHDGDDSAHRDASVEARRSPSRPFRDWLPGFERSPHPGRGRRGLGLGRRLDHHPHDRLGSRAAHQHPAPVAELGLDLAAPPSCTAAAARGRRRARAARSPAPAAGASCAAASADSGTPRRAHEVADDQAGEHAVAGGREIGEHDVARLLAADREVVLAPSPRSTFRSPTGVSTTPIPAPRKRAPQPEVRHHRHRDRVVAQHPALVPVERGHHHDLVAVDELAVSRRPRRTRSASPSSASPRSAPCSHAPRAAAAPDASIRSRR